jgi:hypothetical protein
MKGNEMNEYCYVHVDGIGRVLLAARSGQLKSAVEFARDQLRARFMAKHPSSPIVPLTLMMGLDEEQFCEWKKEFESLPEDYNPREMNGEGYSGWTFDWPELPADKEKTDETAGL